MSSWLSSLLRQPRWITLALVVVVLALPGTSPVAEAGGHQPYEPIAAREILANLVSGKAVVMRHREVRDRLDLPDTVRAPLIVRDSRFLQGVDGAFTVFQKLVDLSGSEFRGGLRFTGARFEAPVRLEGVQVEAGQSVKFDLAIFQESGLFSGAQFSGPTTLARARFHGQGRFAGAQFGGAARFSLAGFDGDADFTSAIFRRAASFDAAEFDSTADFTAARFFGKAVFDSARFSGLAQFIGTAFIRIDQKGVSASFDRARFDGGATFLHAFFSRPATFSLSRAAADMDFEGAIFRGGAEFSTASFLASARFAGASLGGELDFDQAVIRDLDLRGASIGRSLVLPREPKTVLPRKNTALPTVEATRGRIGALRLDLSDVSHLVDPGGDNRGAQKRALSLVERTAKGEDDLATAADARMQRLELVREARSWFPEVLDYLFWFGLLGYLVRPLHQLVAIGVLLLLGVMVRGWRIRRLRFGFWARLRRLESDLMKSLRVLLQLSPPDGGGEQVEYLAFKILMAVMLINAGNVWPVVHDLLDGFKP
jgi:uncharacterized protein YjbI with pentapeptide repeats